MPIAAWPSYDLTTIRQRSNIMVDETIDLLLTQMEDVGAAPRHIAVDGPLIFRSSARKPRRMEQMRGFDTKFKDFPDYILGITKEIWEDRGIATLHKYYASDIVVRSPASIVFGNKDVIAATMATIAEFPDRTLYGEDVIWSGTPEEGMLSSHRLLSTATHLGDGVYGKASGTKLVYRIIADCHAINNQINDEWLIRDQGAVVRQMGFEPQDYARDLITREGGPENCVKPFTPEVDQQGAYRGKGNDNEWGRPLRRHPHQHHERRYGSDNTRIRPGLPSSNIPAAGRDIHIPMPIISGWVFAPVSRVPSSGSTIRSVATIR